jgi:hypothetical protein
MGQAWRNSATLGIALVDFQFPGMRAASNTTAASHRATKWLGLVSGLNYHAPGAESNSAGLASGSRAIARMLLSFSMLSILDGVEEVLR